MLLDWFGNDVWFIMLISFVLVDVELFMVVWVLGVLKFLYWCFMYGDDFICGSGFVFLFISV